MPKNAIVLGMPRSGTSLTAAIFARQGYHLGAIEEEKSREGDDDNPFGYFEADDLIAANVEVLRAAGYEFHNTWLFEPIEDEASAAIGELQPWPGHQVFLEQYESKSPWLWKDPRLCFTIDYWWPLLDPENTRVVFVRRDPRQIYQSFRRKGWCPAGSIARRAVLQRIEQHVRAARHTLSRLRIAHLEVDYSHYLQQPALVAHRLGEFLELDLSVEDLNVRSDLNHSSARGRISARLRSVAALLPRGPFLELERRLPRRLVGLAFPERKYVVREATLATSTVRSTLSVNPANRRQR